MAYVIILVELALLAAGLAGMWKIYEKAGKPGWAGIVPIYNLFVLTEIVGRPILWFVLCLIPCTFPVMIILLMIDLAKSFGKTAGYGIGLAFLPFVFAPMLGFGPDRYIGPAAKNAGPPTL